LIGASVDVERRSAGRVLHSLWKIPRHFRDRALATFMPARLTPSATRKRKAAATTTASSTAALPAAAGATGAWAAAGAATATRAAATRATVATTTAGAAEKMRIFPRVEAPEAALPMSN